MSGVFFVVGYAVMAIIIYFLLRWQLHKSYVIVSIFWVLLPVWLFVALVMAMANLPNFEVINDKEENNHA